MSIALINSIATLHKIFCVNRRQLSKTATTLRKKRIKQSFHTPVLLDETIEGLNLQKHSNPIVLDMTFGAGGHSKEILIRHKNCHVIALDRDIKAHNIAKDLAQEFRKRVTPLLGKFSEVDHLLKSHGYSESSLDGVIIDAGCSSMQFDEAERGFSLSKDGPLDMRMDGTRNSSQVTAADVVNYLSLKDLTEIIGKYGQERYPEKIAQSIVENRPFSRTKQLAEAIGNTFSISNHMIRMDAIGRRCHSATKTFMALRIFVNDELNELHTGIEMAEKFLKNDGRLATITFHSLEHKIVRKVLNKRGGDGQSPWHPDKEDYAKPFLSELETNPRSRSAFLRVATRTRKT
ncbi:12S rRNA N(4)-cytidine methyltransferase METTL15-like isoform X1 [Clavelina lepadiformis]|uniref:12S rRNA N(4)-cytidine methyltransferase METTL15-like isoform X1 n=1 Tax=Clavelina lepadiformis TaxID=159417 RepID=UPI0040433AFE